MDNLKNFTDNSLIIELQSRGYINTLLHKDDITTISKELGETLNDDEILTVIEGVEKNHLDNSRLKWLMIEVWIMYVINNRKK
jgi:hypothetical protein